MGAALAALEIADPPAAWAALGFAVVDSRIGLGGVALRLGGSGNGITGWALNGVEPPDLLPSTSAPTAPVPVVPHPNGAIALDHVVITTPDFDATAETLADAGMAFRRVREAGPGVRQGFRRLGPAIMEVVQAPGAELGFWGLVVIVDDLAALSRRLGPRLQEIRDAVQPGRQIATLARSAGLSTRVAFMGPE